MSDDYTPFDRWLLRHWRVFWTGAFVALIGVPAGLALLANSYPAVGVPIIGALALAGFTGRAYLRHRDQPAR